MQQDEHRYSEGARTRGNQNTRVQQPLAPREQELAPLRIGIDAPVRRARGIFAAGHRATSGNVSFNRFNCLEMIGAKVASKRGVFLLRCSRADSGNCLAHVQSWIVFPPSVI